MPQYSHPGWQTDMKISASWDVRSVMWSTFLSMLPDERAAFILSVEKYVEQETRNCWKN
jgi:hypothetical protein